jgi:uncharacterized protein YbaR (Trm112 family)
VRDYFATAALLALIACPNTRTDILLEPLAYQIADRMLKARNP